CQQYEDLFRTF
nr:immunoglobulin light chain junction region [Macaca mulatta]